MIDSTMDPRLAASVADAKDLDRFKSEMEGLRKNLSGGEPDKAAKLKKACQNFEAVFIGKLWEQMKQSVPKEGYLHSKQEDSYMSMFNRDFSEKMAEAGGIGLADMIFDQLSRKLKEASHDTLSGGVDVAPVKAGPIPLERSGSAIALNRAKGMTLEDWGGSAEVVNSKGTVSAAATGKAEESAPAGRVLSDVEVKARLEELARRLEARRTDADVVGGRVSGRRIGYETEAADGEAGIGRKLAEIG
ncbi:rod-binding protein [Desulfovibrio sp. Fe33]|uniref:rod-binding protein n=1 Tax=Desulfovibrio sp. Fe33 TaxID=3020842 RepID=UPI00234D6CEE|nr:rod-binding protein [Desulfovibrio sp. Fe33]